jgi:hypothetical protein
MLNVRDGRETPLNEHGTANTNTISEKKKEKICATRGRVGLRLDRAGEISF